MEFFKSKIFIKFSFLFLVFFGILTLFLSFVLFKGFFDIPLLGSLYGDLRINAEAPFDSVYLKKFIVKINGKEIEPYLMKTKNSYFSYEQNNSLVYSITFKVKDGEFLKNEFKNVVISIGSNIFYFNGEDILNFEKNTEGEYILPKDVKYDKNSKFITDKGSLKNFQTCFLSLFYNPYYFIIPFFFFALSFLIYSLNKEKINFGFEVFKQHAIWFVMLIVFVLRIAFDSGLDFWTDELYTATVAGNPNLPFISVFSDPGNPPLFFIFARYWQMIFSHNETLLRLLPCIFSILTAGAIYLFVKSFSNKKFALLSSFLFGVNIYSIQASSDFRCYSLAALEAVLLSYYLFKIIKDGKNRDFIIYGILAALSFNTHYFQALFLLGCFIWGEILIKKGKLKFLYSNLIAFLTFLPYFLMTGLNKALISDTFNRFQRPEITEIINDIFLLYSNKAVVIVLLILFFVSVFKFGEKIFDKQVRKIFLFSMYSVLFLYLSAYLFSIVKPVIRDYYFIILVPFVSISISSLFFISIKKRFLKFVSVIFFILVLFVLQSDFLRKDTVMLNRISGIFKFAYFDSGRYQDKKIAIVIQDTKNYSFWYREFLRGNEEIIAYNLIDDLENLYEAIEGFDADIFYAKLQHRKFPLFVLKMAYNYDISMIRTNKDVIIARIVKRQR